MSAPPITVCFPFIGDEIGGSHISAAKLIAALDGSVVRPIVALHETRGPVADDLARRGIPFVKVPGERFPARASGASGGGVVLYMLRNGPAFRRFLREQLVDIVHTNDGRMHVAWGLAARLAGARHVWHHRGDPDARGVNLLAPLCASRIVTVSRFARPRRPILNVEGRTAVIYSPFDQAIDVPSKAAARAIIVEATGLPADTRFLGYFGLLIERKRPLAFVEAVAAYGVRHPNVPVAGLIFGVPGAESPDLDRRVMERARELGISDRIRLMGFRQPVEPWMRGIDVLVVPAVREPFGRTLIEAMYLETPVVAADDGGNSEAITHGEDGYLVAPDRPAAFAEPIHRLLTDPAERARIAGTARRRALERYGAARHVADVTALYRELVAQPDGLSAAAAAGAQT